MRKKICGMVACMCAAVLMLSSMVYAVETFTWEYDTDTKTVIIDGTGDVPNYYFTGYGVGYGHHTPWVDYRKTATSVIVKEGITGLGLYCFVDFTLLDDVYFENRDIVITQGALPFESGVKRPVIHGYAMSTAEQYASEEGYKFVFIDVPKYGDMSKDGQYDVFDALYVLKMVAGSADNYKFTADYNQDGNATVSDALGILKEIAR